MKFNIKQTLRKAISAHKEGNLQDAENLYRIILQLYPLHPEANKGMEILESNKLIHLFQNGHHKAAIKLAKSLTERFPKHQLAWKILGSGLVLTGKYSEALNANQTATFLSNQDFEAHFNLGVTFKKLGKYNEAEASYKQAIALKEDYVDAQNNLGSLLRELGRLDESETVLRKTITLKADFTGAIYNLGSTLKELGKFDEAEAYYRQAILLRPEYAEAHRYLTVIKKFDSQDEQYLKMQELYLDIKIKEEMRCHINFGLAKACDDLGDFKQAFKHLNEGNAMRKKLLNYDIGQDKKGFEQIKTNYQLIAQYALDQDKIEKKLMPIFIVGLPRSGTTLVEQIISSHSKVTGAGELSFVFKFGKLMATGSSMSSSEALARFRHEYLTELMKVSKGNKIVTDKMPHNFLYLGLVTAAFPEAKIVHVKRDPAAVCWANYKQYFPSKNLCYCYALEDIISYHALYENLMQFWENSFGKRIYNLDYDLLTVNQENETRSLINFLGLDWDEKYLSPQKNKRTVLTASNTQIRKKVYQGSSQVWKKYEPFLDGVFDIFK